MEGSTIPPAAFQVGQDIYFLSNYNLIKGTVLSVGKTRLKIAVPPGGGLIAYETRVAFEKCAHATESVAVIWEMWKGVNGRGGYRLERSLYPHRRCFANAWPFQGYVWEKSFGVEQ